MSECGERMGERMGDTECECDQIEQHLYLGNLNTANSHQEITSLNIKRILSVILEPNQYQHNGVKYMWIKLEDDEEEDLLSHLPECVRFIREGIDSQENVFVHCAQGISRSASVVIAYLMSKHSISYFKALDDLKAKRYVSPNKGFRRQLFLYEALGYQIDLNHRKFRHHLLQSFVANLRNNDNFMSRSSLSFRNIGNSFSDMFTVYYDMLSRAERNSNTELVSGFDYRCAHCDTHLFNQINEVTNDTTKYGNRYQCSKLFIEPQKWMSPSFASIDNSMTRKGVIKCSCDQLIGNFDFTYKDFICDCAKHQFLIKCLVIEININAVKTIDNN